MGTADSFIRACWLSWLAVQTADRAEVVTALGLTDVRETDWAAGARFGKAQLFFHSEQNDGEAWLIAEAGRVLRRWISEYPGLALGEPFGVERRLLDASCWATTVAAEASIDPTATAPDTGAPLSMLVARAPAWATHAEPAKIN